MIHPYSSNKPHEITAMALCKKLSKNRVLCRTPEIAQGILEDCAKLNQPKIILIGADARTAELYYHFAPEQSIVNIDCK